MPGVRDMQSEARIVKLDQARRVRDAAVATQPCMAAISKRRLATARALVVLGSLAGAGFGLSAFLIDLTIVYEEFGTEGLTLSVLLAPLTFLSIPWYALLNQAEASPILLGYAAPLAGWLVVGFGRSLKAPSHAGNSLAAKERVRATGNVIAFRPLSVARPRNATRRHAQARASRRAAMALARNWEPRH